MRKWEDIVKEKLEGYGSTLPEGSLADFRARRDGRTGAPATKRFPLVWALAPALAVLAAVLFLRQPAAPDEGVRLVQQPAKPVPVATDSSATGTVAPEASLIAQADQPKVDAARSRKAVPTAAQPARNVSAERANDSQQDGNVSAEPEIDSAWAENVSPEANDPSTALTAEEETPANNPAEERETPASEPDPFEPSTALAELPEQSPFVPEAYTANSSRVNFGTTAAAVSGGGLLTAAALSLLAPQAGRVESVSQQGGKYGSSDPVIGGSIPRSVDFCFPLRLGLSARVPLVGRLNLTTGLDYSLYTTKLTYTTFTDVQRAHYLGVPVRLDWTLLGNKWLELYVGGGLEGDICLAMTLNGKSTCRDGFALSLLGAAGLQLNLSKRLGLFVEPQLSRTVPSRGRCLPTYRTQDPVVFTVNSGIRITFNK